MGLYPACNLPWIGKVVDNFAQNPVGVRSQADFSMCCTAPGECTNEPVAGRCPLGYLDCHLGNSRYTCRWGPDAGTCYQEGTLEATRSLPCAPTQLTEFLKTQTCMSGFSTVYKSTVCCTDETTAASCAWASICLGYRSYHCQGGAKSAVCYTAPDFSQPGYQYRVQEVGLGNEVESDCLAMTLPASGCSLGGAGPPRNATTPTGNLFPSMSALPPRPSQSGGPSGGGGGGGGAPAPTGSGSKVKGSTKWMVLCVMAPVLVQMLYL